MFQIVKQIIFLTKTLFEQRASGRFDLHVFDKIEICMWDDLVLLVCGNNALAIPTEFQHHPINF